MPSFEVDFDVICNECGGELSAKETVRRSSLSPDERKLHVSLCDTCTTDLKDDLNRLIEDRDRVIAEQDKTIERLAQEIEDLRRS